jgi:hypothetical protein
MWTGARCAIQRRSVIDREIGQRGGRIVEDLIRVVRG